MTTSQIPVAVVSHPDGSKTLDLMGVHSVDLSAADARFVAALLTASHSTACPPADSAASRFFSAGISPADPAK